MNTPNDDGSLRGRFIVLGKVGRGRAVLMKTTVVERSSEFTHTSLDSLLAAERSRISWQKPQVWAGILDPLQSTPAQMILGNPSGDRELRRRMTYFRAAAEGKHVLELIRRDSRFGAQYRDVELTAGEYFTVDSSQLSCSTPEKLGRLGERN